MLLSLFVSFSTLVAFLLADLVIFYVIEYLHTGLVSTVVRAAPRKIVNFIVGPCQGHMQSLGDVKYSQAVGAVTDLFPLRQVANSSPR